MLIEQKTVIIICLYAAFLTVVWIFKQKQEDNKKD